MYRTAGIWFAVVAVIAAVSAPSHAASTKPVPAHASPAAGPLRAAVPMVYKRYGTPGARSSWDAQRSSTLVVQNLEDVSASATICFNASVLEGTPLGQQTWEQCYELSDIQPGASYPVQLDALAEVPGPFAGSARVYSTSAVVALGTHAFSDTNNFLAISAANAVDPVSATERAYVPTYYSDAGGLEGTHAVSVLFAQNVDDQDNHVKVEFFTVGASTATRTVFVDLAPGRSARLEAPSLFARFNGSAKVSATRFDGTAGMAGAHVFELAQGSEPNVVYNLAKAYAGFAKGSSTLHMPTALCQAFGSPVTPAQSTAYAIQNVSANAARVAVIFEPGDYVQALDIPANSKASLQTCAVVPQGFSGAAEIRADARIVAVGKALAADQQPGTGTVTAFEGVSRGASELGVPYVRWASDIDYLFSNGARSSIAVQNNGTVEVQGVLARYFSTAGSQDIPVGNIAAGAKANTNPSQVTNPGIYDAIRNGMGSVEIIGPQGSELSALVRVYRRPRNVARSASISEDYVAFRKGKQQASCECAMHVPQPGMLPIRAAPYRRGRTGTTETAFCLDPGDDKMVFPPTFVATATGDNCQECNAVCQLELTNDYYFYVNTFRPFGLPVGPKDSPSFRVNELDDKADLIVKDPCKTTAPAFNYEELRCTDPSPALR